MSCQDCKDAEELASNQFHMSTKIYYRWGAARVVIIACPVHGAEILEVLNGHQQQQQKAERFRKLIKDTKQNENQRHQKETPAEKEKDQAVS